MPALAEVLHGSTIAINTVLERKGARTALITTRGFRDTYAIGRGNRIEAFNLFFHRPKPLIPRDLTFEVTERMNAQGEVLTALDEDEVHALVDGARAEQDVEAVAVCLLHAYANPRMSAASARSCAPRARAVRHAVARDRARVSRIRAHLHHRAERLRRAARAGLSAPPRIGSCGPRRFGGKINIMRSNGGVMSIGLAQEQPVAMMESGPVAGMIGAGRLAGACSASSALSASTWAAPPPRRA